MVVCKLWVPIIHSCNSISAEIVVDFDVVLIAFQFDRKLFWNGNFDGPFEPHVAFAAQEQD